MRRLAIVTALLALLLPGCSQPQAGHVYSVGELNASPPFGEGTILTVRGVLEQGMHGSWLRDDECKKGCDDILPWGRDDNLQGWEQVEAAREAAYAQGYRAGSFHLVVRGKLHYRLAPAKPVARIRLVGIEPTEVISVKFVEPAP